MSSKSIYHYVYRITNLVEGKHYYGKRSSRVLPDQDIGIKYFSSSSDKQFIQDQKQNPQNYKYKIVARFDTAKEAINMEIRLHEIFDVGRNPKFYNKAKQSSTGRDTTGMISVFDEKGVIIFIPSDHPKYLSGYYKALRTNTASVQDKDGNRFSVQKDDPRVLSGELFGFRKGNECSIFKDKDGNRFSVQKDDPRVLSGELVGITKGKTLVKDKYGNRFYVYTTDPRYLSGELVHHTKGTAIAIELASKRKLGRVDINDPRWITGEIVGPRSKFLQ